MLGINYLQISFGSIRLWYRDISEIAATITELNMPDDEALWSWGHYWRSEGNYTDHLRGSFSDLADHLSDDDISVDSVILSEPCYFNSVDQFSDYFKKNLRESLGIASEHIHVVTGHDCVNNIQALATARDLIAAGRKNVLILAAEQVADETKRFQKFSLFSDCSLAMVVGESTSAGGYEIVDVHVTEDPEPRWDLDGVLTRTLDRQCVDETLTANGLTTDDIDKVCYLNLYKAIAEMKARDLGFAADKVYTENIVEIGHCFGVDPLVNLQSYHASPRHSALTLLCASGRCHAGAAVLRKL